MSRRNDSSASWKYAAAVVRPALRLAPQTYLNDLRARLIDEGVQTAVAEYDTTAVYNWIIRLIDRQGISNAAAIGFAAHHGGARWADVAKALARRPVCPKLCSYWHYAGCGYRKDAQWCARPNLLPACPLPLIPARKGALNQAAVSLALFVRDACGGDFVAWIDDRLATADPGMCASGRASTMRAAVLDPLVNIAGTGPKVWSMVLAELLLGADPDRERWVTSGASFVAVDSLVHAFLHRTGILRRLDAEHAYGPACYGPGGCVGIIEGLAERIDAREFSPDFPAVFPRWVQFAIWWFCAADGWAICNANKIDDRTGCLQRYCPSFSLCGKMVIKPLV